MNDVLTRFIASGTLEPKETMPTVAPSMDIQIPSSLERLIYDLEGDTSSFIINYKVKSCNIKRRCNKEITKYLFFKIV